MPNILAPMCAMVLLTFVVWVWMYGTRLPTMLRSGRSLQTFADEAKAASILKDVMGPSDNLENLFEMPVLFFAAVLVILQTGLVDSLFVQAAWAYVALRAVHSVIHCTSNHILSRFTSYFVSSLVLWAIWGRIALRVCCPHSGA